MVGPMYTEEIYGAGFLFVFKEDYADMIFVKTLKQKSDIVGDVKSIIAYEKTAKNTQTYLRSGNAKAFWSIVMNADLILDAEAATWEFICFLSRTKWKCWTKKIRQSLK